MGDLRAHLDQAHPLAAGALAEIRGPDAADAVGGLTVPEARAELHLREGIVTVYDAALS